MAMDCPVCQSPVPNGGTWCLYCGAPVKSTAVIGDDVPLSQLEAERLRADGLYREAIAIYVRLIEAAEDETAKMTLLEALGDTFEEQGDIRSAVKAYRRAIQMHSTEALQLKYDKALDGLRAVPADVPSRPKVQPTVRITPQAETVPMPPVEEVSPFAALRHQLTPQLATVIMGTAMMAVISAMLYATRPWTQSYMPPSRPIAITDASGGTRMSLPVITSPETLVPGAVTVEGKTLHYIKPAEGTR